MYETAMTCVAPVPYAPDAGASDDEFVLPNVSTLDEALALLFPETLEPEAATMHVDQATRRQLGVVIVGEDANEEAEVYFLDESREVTIFQRLSKSGEPLTVDMLLGGRLPFIEVTRPPFITEQVREQQRALNLAQSMIPRNATTGGFLERLLLNAQPPGEWERDAEGNRTGRWLPGVYRVGSGTTNFVPGIPVEITNPDGSKRIELTTPSAIFRDPVPVQPAVDASNEHYKSILSEVDQLHVLIAGDATSSGISRQHARADFVASVRKTGKRVNRVGRWLLETTLAMAEMLMGAPGRYTDTLRANFSVTYDYGPLSPEDRAQNNQDVKDGTMSRKTAMVRNNITDIAAETEEIEAQPSAIATRETATALAVAGWVSAGADFAGACARLNLTPEEIDVLRPQFEDDETGTTPPTTEVGETEPNDNPDVTGGSGGPSEQQPAKDNVEDGGIVV